MNVLPLTPPGRAPLRVLTIAGSDSGGGAGIQADMRTFALLGIHSLVAVTAVTVQNSVGVKGFHEIPVDIVAGQIEAVATDIGVQAAKTGMLSSSTIIEAVAESVREHRIARLVVDPVMVAKGGARLLRDDAVDALRRLIVPLATVITPNLPEAEVLLGRAIASLDERRQAARELVAMGARIAVVKGGHAEGDVTDVYFDGDRMVELPGERVATPNTHGSGCVFSAAIAAGLARDEDPLDAVTAAKRFISKAIEASLELGRGHGPVNPAFRP